MDEYTPIDLKAFHNAGLELLGEQGTALIGPQEFRGLPFLVGTNPLQCFVAFGEGLQPASLSIPIDQSAQSVIVAHRLLVSGITAGDPVGEHIADYVFTYQNGDEERVTMRDRFEITEIPTSWGQLPFSAVPDQSSAITNAIAANFISSSDGRQHSAKWSAWHLQRPPRRRTYSGE